jgi:hypothetical protein
MAIDGVGGRTTYLGAQITNLKTQFEQLQVQLATGKVSTDYAGQGPERGFAFGLRTQLTNIGAFANTATNVNTRINVANLSLQGLAELGTGVKTAANNATQTLGSNGKTSGQLTAQAAFDNAIQLLNTRSGDRYLFSGRATDTPATAPASAILNGSGGRAGLVTLIDERRMADQGTAMMGRLAVSSPALTPAVTEIAEDGSPLGLKLASIASTLGGALVTQPTGAPPTAAVDLGAVNPTEGQKITFNFNLPDGSSESITLTATTANPPPKGSFTIGADTAATTVNLQGALTSSIQTLSDTALVAASAIAASGDFFDNAPPLRVDGPPFATATGTIAGTDANTVMWYTGEPGAPGDAARGTAVARVDQSITVSYGARADEQAFRDQLKQIAVYAAVTTSSSNPNAAAQVTALSQRVMNNLVPQSGHQTIQDIQAEFAGAQTAIKSATDRQTQVKAMSQSMLDSIEGISQDEVATKLLALQTSLQASYQTTSMLYQTTLLNYL